MIEEVSRRAEGSPDVGWYVGARKPTHPASYTSRVPCRIGAPDILILPGSPAVIGDDRPAPPAPRATVCGLLLLVLTRKTDRGQCGRPNDRRPEQGDAACRHIGSGGRAITVRRRRARQAAVQYRFLKPVGRGKTRASGDPLRFLLELVRIEKNSSSILSPGTNFGLRPRGRLHSRQGCRIDRIWPRRR